MTDSVDRWLASLVPCFTNPEVFSVDFYTFSGKVTATVTRAEFLEARDRLAGLLGDPEGPQQIEKIKS